MSENLKGFAFEHDHFRRRSAALDFFGSFFGNEKKNKLLRKCQLYLFGMVSKRRGLIGSALVTDEREWVIATVQLKSFVPFGMAPKRTQKLLVRINSF